MDGWASSTMAGASGRDLVEGPLMSCEPLGFFNRCIFVAVFCFPTCPGSFLADVHPTCMRLFLFSPWAHSPPSQLSSVSHTVNETPKKRKMLLEENNLQIKGDKYFLEGSSVRWKESTLTRVQISSVYAISWSKAVRQLGFCAPSE